MATTASDRMLASKLRISVARTARRLRQEGETGLSPSQLSALAVLDRHGPLTPSELAAREGVSRPTTTRLIARLEVLGLVGRTRDPEDRRSSVLALTPKGHDLLAELRTRKDAYLEQGLARLTDDERAILEQASDLLDRMRGEVA